MKSPDEIKKAMLHCSPVSCRSDGCPYRDDTPKYEGDMPVCRMKLWHDMVCLIRQLEARVPRWIPVEERLPEEGVDVVIRYGKDGFCEVASRSGENWHCAEYIVLGGEWITHWMPLPEPPEVEHETVHDCNS